MSPLIDSSANDNMYEENRGVMWRKNNKTLRLAALPSLKPIGFSVLVSSR